MPSRRFHQKRRHGCANCKQKRTRCGEERPTCQNCVRWGVRCSYLDTDPPEDRATQQGSSLNQERTSSQSQLTLANFDHDDAELIAHYANLVSYTTTDETEHLPAWQVTIPNMALSCPYLQHGMLALSAMHIRLASSPARRRFYVGLARQHLNQALESYIPQLGTSTEESCPALFAFSVILPGLSYSFLQSDDNGLQGEDYIKQFIGIWDFLHGATAVAKDARSWIRTSAVSSLVTLRRLENIIPHLAENPRMALQALLDHAELYGLPPALESEERSVQTSTDPRTWTTDPRHIYKNSVEMLSNAFPTNTGRQPQLAAVIGWPVFIEAEFLHLLKRNDPMALIILAHYGRALHTFSGFWWLQGLGFRLVQAVAQILGSDFSPLLQWPLREVSLVG